MFRGFITALRDYRERAELHNEIGVLTSRLKIAGLDFDAAKSRSEEFEQLKRLADAELEIKQLHIDGLLAVVESYRQEQLAQARIHAAKAIPINHANVPII